MDDVDIDAFVKWFQFNGGFVDKKVMGIIEFPDSGRGAIALCDILERFTLFTLPHTITLSTRMSPLPTLFGFDTWHIYELHKGWIGLILCMMWEDAWAHELDVTDEGKHGQCVQTKWGPYMHTLPATFDTPMFWNEEELEELRGTSVIDKIGHEDAERSYNEQLVPAIKSSPTLFPPPHHEKWYTLDAYHRAGSRILSRSFTVSHWTDGDKVEDSAYNSEVVGNDADEAEDPHPNAPIESPAHVDNIHPSLLENPDEGLNSEDDEDDPLDVAMVPMADLLNARWGSENAKLFHEPSVLRMVTTKNIKQGEQIFNTYGDLPNSDLLRQYRHVDLVQLHPSPSSAHGDAEMKDGDADVETMLDLGNPSDIVEVRADLVVRVVQAIKVASKAKDVHAHIEWWLDEGEDDTFLLSLPNPGSRLFVALPSGLVSLTCLLIFSEPDFKSARSKGKLPKGKLKNDLKDDKEVLEILDEVLRQHEGMYAGGNIKDDERLISHPGILIKRKRHAVIVRLGEKQILECIRQTLRTILAEPTSGPEYGNEEDGMDTRGDKQGGNGGKEIDSSKKRAVSGAGGNHGQKKARR